jgi:hypothetical protein
MSPVALVGMKPSTFHNGNSSIVQRGVASVLGDMFDRRFFWVNGLADNFGGFLDRVWPGFLCGATVQLGERGKYQIKQPEVVGW